MSKFLEFVDNNPDVLVLTKKRKGYLGQIKYYLKWKQFIFEPNSYTIYSNECLRDIADELTKLNDERKSMAK